jgi:rhodanese-related sulfurtransferase
MRYFILIFIFGIFTWAAPYRIIDLDEAKAHYNAHNALFIDARDAKMYARGTIMRALNIPLKRFKRMSKWFPTRKDAPLLIFCNGVKCGKSIKLAEKLAKTGYTDLMVYREGYPEWKSHKLPIMAIPKPCHSGDTPYTPSSKPVSVQGAKLYLASDDSTRVDARWFVPLVKQSKLPDNIQLVDVRPSEQYKEGHIEGAVNIPYNPEKKSINSDIFPSHKAIIFYCSHGAISADAYDSLPEDVAKSVKVLEANIKCLDSNCTLGL